ncbi:hypothetical protein ACVWY2_001244 [Bradyrhizobium sp. JR6.1]
MIGQTELSLEATGRDALIDIFTFGLFDLRALDGQNVLLCRYRDLVRCKAGNRERDLVPIFRKPLDVIGGIVVLAGTLDGFSEVKEPVKADGWTGTGERSRMCA